MDIYSDTWKDIKAFAEKEISNCHLQLERDGNNGVVLRCQGRIGAFRDILRLERVPAPLVKSEEYL